MMKVKNIFSNRRTKKKKNSNQPQFSVAEVSDVNHAGKLIISTADTKHDSASGKEKDPSDIAECAAGTESRSAEEVVLRNSIKKKAKWSDQCSLDGPTKLRASSTSSIGSSKGRPRRPWSFIDQVRRQDSRESAYSTGSLARTTQVVEELTSGTLPYGDAAWTPQKLARDEKLNFGALTLPRSLTPERFEQESKGTVKQDNSLKRRTMDFRFFSFFKRSGASSANSDSESPSGSLLSGTGRSSLRGKYKGKKRQGHKKKKDVVESRSNGSDTLEDVRLRSVSDGMLSLSSPKNNLEQESFQIFPPGIYDSDPRLNTLLECPEPSSQKTFDKRVPENGESASDFITGISDVHSSVSLIKVNISSRKYERKSDPTNCHSILRVQMSEGSTDRLMTSQPASDPSNAPSSRRSSTVCEPRDFPLLEDSISTFDNSFYVGPRYKKIHSAGSVPHLPVASPQSQRISRAHSNDISKPNCMVMEQPCCSQSATNLAREPNQSIPSMPKSSTVGRQVLAPRKIDSPSLHQRKEDEQDGLHLNTIPPPSPVLRAIGYPGVIFREKKNNEKQRPSPKQRSQLVMSLNVEDLPTYYSQKRFDQARVGGFPSCEDILKESRAYNKRGSSGVHFAGTAGARARRRGVTISTHGIGCSGGFADAMSFEDLDSLSSSNFGSKQSLSDLTQLDEDELLNGLFAKRRAVSHTLSGNIRIQEPSSKKTKAIRKSVVSLANLISPGKPNQKDKLQRSSSFKESGLLASNSAAAYSFKPYRPPSNTPNKKKNNRRSKLWCETFDHRGIDEGEIKRQEAMFELFQGERDLVQDLTMAKQTYRDSMVTLKMLSDAEVTLIFGKLGCLLPLHEELLVKLEQARGEDGRTLAIGYIFVEWFPRISAAYRDYCANQSDAKYALDAAVERDDRVRDFLQRCLESPFSRKLDLWSYLDLPRTRLVKYPLLLQNILKRTPVHLGDERRDLNEVMEIIGNIIEKVDETTGEQQCCYIRSKLEYLDDKQRSPFVENSRLMLCSGQLKNNRGTKMHVFLFEEALVLTRQATRSNKVSYQVYRNPLPLRSLTVDANEGVKLSGSFKSGILSSEKVKHSFRVRSEEFNVTYTLQASEEHDRKQWINAIQDALSKYRTKNPELVMSIENHIPISKRRATYDPSSKKNLASRALNRSSSDKSNASVASSSDKSSTQDEFPEDDLSTTTEEVAACRRARSHTVNAANSLPSVLRKSSGSSTRSDKSSQDEKIQERSSRIESLKDPTSLRNSLRNKSLARHFSLGKGDKAKTVLKTGSDQQEKKRNKCQRSRSLSASPQTVKSLTLGHKKLRNVSTAIVTPSAAKPPIGPSSPFLLRRTPKQTSSLKEAQSTPNLASIAQNTSFNTLLRMASTQIVLHDTSSSVGNLREGLDEIAGSDITSNSQKAAENASPLIKSKSCDKPSSESDVQDIHTDIEISVTYHVENCSDDKNPVPMTVAVPSNDRMTPVLTTTPEKVEEIHHPCEFITTEQLSAGDVDSELSSVMPVGCGNEAATHPGVGIESNGLMSYSTNGQGWDERCVTGLEGSKECCYGNTDSQNIVPMVSSDSDCVEGTVQREFVNNAGDDVQPNDNKTAENSCENENDPQKPCRSEMLEENISSQNNMQTTTYGNP